MAWAAHLQLDYALENQRTVARHVHSGPLRILQSLYPEGDAVCHNVLVHPPGGLVGGDTLDIELRVRSGAHGLVTTPGATRFYRSDGPVALQNTRITLESGSRLEWLPLEALCYSGCHAENHLTMALEPGAELLGWDVTALGLPQADLPFVQGSLRQHIEVPGVWLERGTLRADDHRLLESPAGLAGMRCMASLFFVAGSPLPRARKELALDAVRALLAEHPLASRAGATSPHPQVVVVRVLAPLVEPAMQLLRLLRRAWRAVLWEKEASSPRIWSM
jgi:urease accessory protein